MPEAVADYHAALAKLRCARSNHIRWRAYANGLAVELTFDPVRTPPSHEHCAFGRWYYHQETQAVLSPFASFQGIETPHKVLHQLYQKVHEAWQSGRQKELEKTLDNLNIVSQQMLEAIELLEQELLAKTQTPSKPS